MKLVIKILEYLVLLNKSGMGLQSIFKKGASSASLQIVFRLKKMVPNINTIIDVGANQGQFALTCSHFFPDSKIHSYEPVPGTFQILESNVKKSKNIVPHNFALGSKVGEIDFYSNEYSHASSALPVSDFQKSQFEKTSKTIKISVPVNTFDIATNDIDLSGIVLLKLDVQGFEKEVLLGALNQIGKVDYLLFEASFISMYDGEPLFDEMNTYVKELGFELVSPLGFLESNDYMILQSDFLYKRKHN